VGDDPGGAADVVDPGIQAHLPQPRGVQRARAGRRAGAYCSHGGVVGEAGRQLGGHHLSIYSYT
jgi:hypothetical protein